MNELKHVGIIVDGNGRWATKRNKSRSEGHLEGSKNLEKLILNISESNIKVLSLYVFSTENFKRDKKEVDYIFSLAVEFIEKELENAIKNDLKINILTQSINFNNEITKTVTVAGNIEGCIPVLISGVQISICSCTCTDVKNGYFYIVLSQPATTLNIAFFCFVRKK